jgi:DNA replication licensing factor MCM6
MLGGGGGGGGPKRVRGGGSAALAPTSAGQVEPVVDATAEAVKTRFLQFLCGYGRAIEGVGQEDPDAESEAAAPVVTYSQQAEVMRSAETSSLFVDFSHVLEFDPDLAQAIQAQYYRWEPFLRRAVFEFVRLEDASYTVNEDATRSQREFFVCFYNFQHVSQCVERSAREIRTQGSAAH